MKKRIVFILWGEIKYDGRVRKEISSLKKSGNEVFLIVSKFNNDDKKNYDFWIEILDFKLKKNPISNFTNYIKMCSQAADIANKLNPDILHCNDLNTLYTAYYYKKRYGNIKVVFDAHELFPEMQKGLIRKVIWNKIEKKLINYVDEIIMPEKNRAIYFEKKHNLSKDIVIIPNYPQKSNIPVTTINNLIEKDILLTKNKKKVLFIGALMSDRNIEEISLAFKTLGEDYALILIGHFSKGYEKVLKNFINKNGLTKNVFYHEPVPNNLVLSYINSSDMGLVFYEKTNLNNYYCASNKLFEFIMCKKPVITNNYPGLIEVVEKNNLGLCIDKVSTSTIVDAVIKAQKIVINEEQDFLWENVEKKYLKVY